VREFRLIAGRFQGVHCIYESTEEFKKKTKLNYFVWREIKLEELQIGNWVQTDDGYVIQILNVYQLKSLNSKATIFIRFPNGTFAVKVSKGELYYRAKLYALTAKIDGNSISGTYRNYSRNDLRVKLFTNLFFSGIEAEKAFLIAYKPKNGMSQSMIRRKSMEALTTKSAKEEIKTYISKFNEEIESKFPLERIIKEIDDLVKYSKKGTKTHRENIELILELKGLKDRVESKKIKNSEVVEASYEQLPPDELR